MRTQTDPHRPATGPRKIHRKRTHATQGAPAAKHRRSQCPTEHCSRCGLALGPAEPAFLWQTEVVCGACHATRQASLLAAALAAPRLPRPDDAAPARRPWWRRALRGPVNLLCLPVTALGLLSRKNRRRRQQAAVAPLFDHLHRLAHRA